MIMMKQEVGSALDEVEERERVETAETPGDDDCGNRVAQKGQRMLFFHSLSDSQFLTCTKCTPTQVEEVPDPGLRLTLSGSLFSRSQVVPTSAVLSPDGNMRTEKLDSRGSCTRTSAHLWQPRL